MDGDMLLDWEDPEFLTDPYPTYAQLRAVNPIFWDSRWGVWFFTRHADVQAIFRDRRFGRDPRGSVPTAEIDQRAFARLYPDRYPLWTRYIRESFIDFEPPAHTRLRRLVQGAFTKRSVGRYRPALEAAADELLEHALERGAFDAVAGYAEPLPLMLIGELMGIPEPDRPQLVSWSHSIVRLYDQACSEAEGAAAEAATAEFVTYVAGLMAERRRRPGDDLISMLLAARVGSDVLTDDEVIATSILVLNAGHEATVLAIGNGLQMLAADRALMGDLRRADVSWPLVVEEILRYDSPLQLFERWVLHPLQWGGLRLERGSKVGLLLGSANRDEAVFGDAERFDPGRVHNPHVAFGGGIHRCVGAPLAQMELEVAFSRFVAKVGEVQLVEAPERTTSAIFRGARSLNLSISR